MNKGEIILITFPFTDLSGSKLRPALVLAADKADVNVGLLQQICSRSIILICFYRKVQLR